MTEELIIKEPEKSLMNKVFVAFLYASYFTYVYYLYNRGIFSEHPEVVKIIVYLLILLGILIFSTFTSIATHNIRFRFEEFKIRHEFHVGYLKYKEGWQKLNDLNYLSIYEDQGNFNVIMWYEENNFLNLFSMKSYDEIVKQAHFMANRLNIDLLDATIDDDLNHWVNKKVYKETGKIEYLD